MSWLSAMSLLALALAALPVGMWFANLVAFRKAPGVAASGLRPPVSILIPARDEEHTIGACVAAALASRGVGVEVVVLDDCSQDGTASVVREIAARDPRVRLEAAPPLPPGWCGKQHACAVLGGLARHDLLLFIDADVRLAPDAAARTTAFLESSGAALVSGFPRQVTGSATEKLLLPLIHVVLLGYLPMGRMRRRATDPAFGAGCGQLFIARRDAYERAGGHAAVRGSMHDGLTLPRAFRAAGLATDLFDASDTAVCRMYTGNAACWSGLVKNATEGMAAPRAILPWTLLLMGGHVLPFYALIAFYAGGTTDARPAGFAVAVVAVAALYVMRLTGVVRFGHSVTGALLHPVGVALLVVLQWFALARSVAGRPAAWKGRVYATAAAD